VTARLKRPHISARRGGDVIKRYSGGLHPRPSLYLAATARGNNGRDFVIPQLPGGSFALFLPARK